jgi:2',3'-cyclic-nucleotide 2'-phosphodiesterase (5'-nucleotidase family)
VLDGLKAEPLLVLDSGNALFRAPGVSDDAARRRARFILSTMGKLGTRAMAVGPRDLSAGVDFLDEAAKAAGVQALSANLRKGGALAFPAASSFSVNGVTVAVVGVTAPGPLAGLAGVTASPTLPAVRAALKGLRKRDLTVVMAATSYADALQLAQALDGDVDLVIQSGEFRGAQPPQRVEGGSAYVLASAQRGQALAKVELSLGSSKGRLVDLTSADRDRQQLTFLDSQLETLEARLAAAKGAPGAKDLEATRAQLRARRRALQLQLDQQVAPTARTMRQVWINLSSDVKDDPALKAEVLEHEPSSAGAH